MKYGLIIRVTIEWLKAQVEDPLYPERKIMDRATLMKHLLRKAGRDYPVEYMTLQENAPHDTVDIKIRSPYPLPGLHQMSEGQEYLVETLR